MRKLSDMNNNIFTPQIVDIILPGCSIEMNNNQSLASAETQGSSIQSSHKMSDVEAELEAAAKEGLSEQ